MCRILINHIIITPWKSGIGVKPTSTNRIYTISNNLHVVASVIYEIVRIQDKELPTIPAATPKKESNITIGRFVGVSLKRSASMRSTTASSDKMENEGTVNEGDDKVINIFKKLGTLISTTVNGTNSENGDVEDRDIKRMLGDYSRPPFEQLETILGFLISEEQIIKTSNTAFGWRIELSNKLDAWITKIVKKVVENKFKNDTDQVRKVE
jgi:hypothetical protein